MRASLFLLCSFLLIYTVFTYGGIRSPDGEVVFRTAESLESRGNFSIPNDLENFPGFGLATGVDQRRYSQFGPLQSILSAPLIRFGRFFQNSEFSWVQPSHFVPAGFRHFLRKTQPELAPHIIRFTASFLILIVSAFNVVVIWRIARRITSSNAAALFTAFLFGLGTLMLPYSGTCFSEPLAMLFLLLCFDRMIVTGPTARTYSVAGLFLGLSVTAHITAILFFPFFAGFIFYKSWKSQKLAGALRNGAAFCGGVAILLGLLAVYNYQRFGDPFETGRTVRTGGHPVFDYGHFVLPWEGIKGLLASSGKGLFFYCPAVMLGLLCWRPFHRSMPALSNTLLAAILFRFFFIASWSDWGGGFCLGPRYLLMLIPFLILPVAVGFREASEKGNKRLLGWMMAFAGICIGQQIYFSTGEIFSYYQFVLMQFKQQGIAAPTVNQLQNSWEISPLWILHKGMRGPFLLQRVPVTNLQLAITLTIGVAGAALMSVRRTLRV